jgi:hypothetical protein
MFGRSIDKTGEKLLEIVKNSQEYTLSKIELELIKDDDKIGVWFNRYKDKNFSKENIHIDKLIIDEFHNGLDNTVNSTGKKIVDFFKENQNNNDTIQRIKNISEKFDFFQRNKEHLPIIVKRNNNDTFSIMLGNHRAMVYYLKGFSEVPVIIAEDGENNHA